MLLRLSHIILVFFLFLGSSGLLVSKHYCRGELKSKALFTKARSCHSNPAKPCPLHGPEMLLDDGCCDDQVELVKPEGEQVFVAQKIVATTPVLLFLPPFLLQSEKGISLDRQIIRYLNYRPPLIVYDRAPLLQTFRC